MAQVAWNKGLNGEAYKKHFKNGMGGQFKKGIVPWNKDKPGYSLSNKGKPGNPNSGYQKLHEVSMDTRKKMSMAKTGDKKFTGFKSALKSRIRVMGEYSKWRSDVFKRDNYHCQNCGEKGYMEAHHIIPFSKIIKALEITTIKQATKCKELWDIGNGITYCKECHILLDEYRGKRGCSIKQLNTEEEKQHCK